jgi:hypothetical protein
VIDENPIRTARRKSRRQEQERCLFCGRRGVLLELDHTAGRNHDPDLTGPLCQPCHAWITELRRRAGADMKKQENPVTRVEYALRAEAVFLHALADAMNRWADLLSKGESL